MMRVFPACWPRGDEEQVAGANDRACVVVDDE
jgi:hypothetical protein